MSLITLPLDDGFSHTITTAKGTIAVSGGSTLILQAGGSGTGADFDGSTYLGIWVGSESGPGITSDSCTLNISGGEATGGSSSDSASASPGLYSYLDSVTISGGTIASGADAMNSPPAAMIILPTACSISGGTFTGGAPNGAALVLSTAGSVHATITGGTYTGGSPSGRSLSVNMEQTSSLTITGGTFNGPMAMRFVNTAAVTFTGSSLSFSAGVLTGTLTDGQAISVAISQTDGGSITVGGTSSSLTFSL